MTTEQLNKSEQYLKGLSDQELSTLVEELEKVVHEDSSPLRKVINDLYGENVGIFVLRVNELIYPLLKEVHSRWHSE
jgi:hypothetical protein